MKNTKNSFLIAAVALSTIGLLQVASATGPSGSPPASNYPDAKFNSIATGPVMVTGSGGGNVDLSVNGRIVTGDASHWGGVWLDSTFKKFIGEVIGFPDWIGMWNGNAYRFYVNKNGQVVIDDADHGGSGTGNGISLVAQDRPLITRAWDTFTSGNYAGLGRWGLFMEPFYLTLGYSDLGGRGVKIARYHLDSTKDEVLQIDENGVSMPRPNKNVDGSTYTDANCTADAGKRRLNPNDPVGSMGDTNCYYPTNVSDTDGLVVKGHLAAKRVGGFFPLQKLVSIPTGSQSQILSCPQANQTAVSCGYNVEAPFAANFYVTGVNSYNSHSVITCNYEFQNNTGAAKNVTLSALCFDPSMYF